MNPGRSRSSIAGWAGFAILSLCVCDPAAFCQRGNPLYGTTPSAIPLVNVGGGPMDAQFFSMDFAQKILAQQNRDSSQNQKERERQQALVDSGAVSAFDLAAPTKAINEFNQASKIGRAHV